MNDIDNLTEEVFCLRYELNILAGVLLKNESERWVPGFLHEQTEHSHISRYELACKYSSGKNVIDVACGIGKGSNMLATYGNANTVHGFDIQEDAIRYATWRNGNGNIEFRVKNAEALGITNQYDLAVSFETVEHLPNYRDFFASIVKCLKSSGYFLISTPISAMSVNKTPQNPYHVQEWGFETFQEILKEFFDIEKVYVQFYPKRVRHNVSRKPLITRIYNKIKRGLANNNHTASIIEAVDKSGIPLSTIEEYKGQYDVTEFGILRTGYQIILAKMKA